MKAPRFEDFEIEYWDNNRFAFLGDGFEMREIDGRDVTNYLGCLNEDGKDLQPDYDQNLIKILGGCYIDEY
jgi:hypothetical protein